MAVDICKQNNLYSPLYNSKIHRDGCWFCNKSSLNSLRDIYNNYPNLWNKLLGLDKDSPYSFRADGKTLHDLDLRFKNEYVQFDIFDFIESE
jgi:hypothetical protein